MSPTSPDWTPAQSRTLRFVAALCLLAGIAYAYSCLFDNPVHGKWGPYECAPGIAGVLLAVALWREATWAVVALLALLAFAIVALIWEAVTGEAAALMVLALPVLIMAGLINQFGRATWTRIKR